MRKLTLVLILTILFVLFVPFAASAENVWVYDDVDIISENTENYIKQLNEVTFANHKAQPKFAIAITEDIPDNIDAYVDAIFAKCGMKTSEESYDVLIVLITNEKKYKIKSGDGYGSGSIIEEDLNIGLINGDVKEMLNNKSYDNAVLEISKKMESMMADLDGGVYEQREAEMSERVLVFEIVLSVTCVVLFTTAVVVNVVHKKRASKTDK